jgi:serine/threonine protein kinase
MLAEHLETHEKVALKIVHMPTIFAINKERHVYRERDLLFQFSNARHIIELKETFIVVSSPHQSDGILCHHLFHFSHSTIYSLILLSPSPQGDESIVFVFEFLPNGDLETLINKLRGTAKKTDFRGVGQDLTKILMAQLVNAIELLQDK